MTIAEIAALIRTAIYGRDVRESIAKGIETIESSTMEHLAGMNTTIVTSQEATDNKISTMNNVIDHKMTTIDTTLAEENQHIDTFKTDTNTIVNNFKSDVNSQVSTFKTDVNTKVDSINTTMTATVESAVESRIPEFGANMLKATETFDKGYWTSYNAAIALNVARPGELAYTETTQQNNYYGQQVRLEVGTQYTLSAWMESDTDMTYVTSTFDTPTDSWDQPCTEANKRIRYAHTFIATEAHKAVGMVGLCLGSEAGPKLKISGMMLAKGLNQSYVPSITQQNEQQAWKYVTLENGWVPSEGQRPVEMYKDTTGRVHFRSGWMKVQGSTNDEMFGLNPGDQPNQLTYAIALAKEATSGNIIMVPVTIVTDMWHGLQVNRSGITAIKLDGISFRAEQLN